MTETDQANRAIIMAEPTGMRPAISKPYWIVNFGLRFAFISYEHDEKLARKDCFRQASEHGISNVEDSFCFMVRVPDGRMINRDTPYALCQTSAI